MFHLRTVRKLFLDNFAQQSLDKFSESILGPVSKAIYYWKDLIGRFVKWLVYCQEESYTIDLLSILIDKYETWYNICISFVHSMLIDVPKSVT